MWGEGTNARGPRMVRWTMDQHILSIEMRANNDRAQHEFEHQTLPQSPVVMAPDQDGAEVANTKEENE